MTRVLLVTTWGTACGIAEHSAYLKEAVEAADREIELTPYTHLHPGEVEFGTTADDFPILHLNYHAALHSQWTPDWIRKYQQRGQRIVVTYHDTGVPNSDQCKQIAYVLRPRLDAMVVHEPFEDLPLEKVHYIRQGVPGWSAEYQFNTTLHESYSGYWCRRRPIVGTVGFPFPWKNYDLLCEASKLAGWATLIIAPGATDEQVARWQALQPNLQVHTAFTERGRVGALLAGCDATAFLYSCANTGTSGAIRQGIAARKPVLALAGCRQFRDLQLAENLMDAVQWIYDGSVHGVAYALVLAPIQRTYPPIVALAERDSWASVGQRYAALYRSLL